MADYYLELGVGSNASPEEIRRAYHKQAVRWHPDKWTRVPARAEEAKEKFQNVQEAYSVLSDGRKRTLYNAGLYDPSEEAEEGWSDFAQEMFSLMAKVRNEEKRFDLSELQDMLCQMMEDQGLGGGRFDSQAEASGGSKRARAPAQDYSPRAVKSRPSGFVHVGECLLARGSS